MGRRKFFLVCFHAFMFEYFYFGKNYFIYGVPKYVQNYNLHGSGRLIALKDNE